MTALLFIVLLAALVVVHEFGHFIVAKRSGIRVAEFAVGFGPRLFGWKRGETEYAFRLFLLGGYVRFGSEPGQEPPEDSFHSGPMLGRILTTAAGPLMNILLAIVLFWALNSAIGLPQVASGAPRISALERGMPAQTAGLRPGDRLVAANGHSLSGWTALVHVVSGADGKPIHFTVLRAGREFQLNVSPKPDPNAAGVMHIGVVPLQVNVQQPFFSGLWHGVAQTFGVIGLLFSAVGGAIARGQSPPVSGIVGIYGAVQQAAAAGLSQVLTLAAVLSANLAIVNLVPFPPLDGARLLVLGYESVIGRRIDPQREAIVNGIGMMILLGLVVLLAYHDVVRMHGTL